MKSNFKQEKNREVLRQTLMFLRLGNLSLNNLGLDSDTLFNDVQRITQMFDRLKFAPKTFGFGRNFGRTYFDVHPIDEEESNEPDRDENENENENENNFGFEIQQRSRDNDVSRKNQTTHPKPNPTLNFVKSTFGAISLENYCGKRPNNTLYVEMSDVSNNLSCGLWDSKMTKEDKSSWLTRPPKFYILNSKLYMGLKIFETIRGTMTTVFFIKHYFGNVLSNKELDGIYDRENIFDSLFAMPDPQRILKDFSNSLNHQKEKYLIWEENKIKKTRSMR